MPRARRSRSAVIASRKADVVRYGLVLLMNRLAAPWQLIRLATRVAESDIAARVAETPYAVAVTIVLGEMESTVTELRTAFKAGKPVTSMLKELHDGARGLRTEMDLSVDSTWSRQLAAIRSDVSNLLKPEIDATPGRVRRLLRPPPAKEIHPGSTVDSIDVDDVQARIEFVGACRNYAGELALSEVTLRSYSELTQYLETGTKVLLDALRHAEDRRTRRSGSRRSRPRSACADRCSASTMPKPWPRPPTSPCRPRPPSASPLRA